MNNPKNTKGFEWFMDGIRDYTNPDTGNTTGIESVPVNTQVEKIKTLVEALNPNLPQLQGKGYVDTSKPGYYELLETLKKSPKSNIGQDISPIKFIF